MAANCRCRVSWIMCVFFATWTYAVTESLQAFCDSREGIVEEDACFYKSNNAEVSWDDARSDCKLPDQNSNADLFYSYDRNVTERVLKYMTNITSGNGVKWWTAASKLSIRNNASAVLWRNFQIPDWLAKINQNLIDKDDNLDEYLMIELKDKIDIHFGNDKARGLCRYSMNRSDEYVSDNSTTITPVTETELPTTSPIETENGTTITPVTETELPTTTPIETQNGTTLTPVTETLTSTKETETHTPTTIPTTIENATTTVTSGTPTNCREETVNGVTWKRLKPGEEDERNCPVGYKGLATWNCRWDGKRIPDQPDYKHCREKWISDAVKDKNSTEGSSQLATDSNNNFLLKPNDLNVMKDTVRYLVEKFYNEFDDANMEQRVQMIDSFVNSIVQIWSNSFDEDKHPAWDKSDEKFRINTTQAAMKQLESVSHTLACFTDDNNDVKGKSITVRPFNLENGQDVVFASSEGQIVLPNFEELQSEPCGDGSKRKRVGVGIEYTNIASKLRPERKELIDMSNTVIGFVLIPDQGRHKLPKNQRIFVTLKTNGLERNNIEPVCSFWDFNRKGWSGSGCWVNRINGTKVVCECDHLTNFAILVIHKDDLIADDKALTILTYIGCTSSTICLIFTIVCLTGFQALRCRRNTITTNLCFMLLAMNLLVLFGLNREAKIGPLELCWAIAIGLHYTLLSSFAWMLMEGYLLYQMIVVVFSEVLNIKMRWFYLLGYGFPLCVVAISSGTKQRNYVNNGHCWLSLEDGIIWSFLGPALGIIFVNLVIFVCAMKAASEVRKKKLHSTQTIAVGWLKGSFSMMCLLGVTWVIGFFYLNEATKFFVYIFTILNSLQGVFIFIFHVVLNEKTRTTIIKIYKTRTGSNTSGSSAKTIRTLARGSFLSSGKKRTSGSSTCSNIS